MLTAEEPDSAPMEDVPISNDDASMTPAAMPMAIDNRDLQSLLPVFYQRFFPFKSYLKWLSYDVVPTKAFTHREFSFTLMNDVYLRWNSFNSLDEFKSELLRLCPAKIDIGAVYTARPKDKKTVAAAVFQPIEKELVFDIDMTDYDDIRTCCSGGDICRECWQFMTVAVKVIDACLRQDFGFSSLLWVYSGRRGVHCWVADARARSLSNEGRKAIVSFLEVIKGGAHQNRKVNLPEVLHPSLSRSRKILQAHFERCLLDGQQILGSPESWEKVLGLIPDEEIVYKLRNQWQSTPSNSRQRWNDMVTEITSALKGKSKRKVALTSTLNNILFQYTYPRLDDKVSVQINHLLKSPFCVHPKTGKVCVPIPLTEVDSFDPMTVPTVAKLIDEVNTYEEAQHEEDPNRSVPADWEKTSLKPYVKVFDTFVKSAMGETLRKKTADAQESMTF